VPLDVQGDVHGTNLTAPSSKITSRISSRSSSLGCRFESHPRSCKRAGRCGFWRIGSPDQVCPVVVPRHGWARFSIASRRNRDRGALSIYGESHGVRAMGWGVLGPRRAQQSNTDQQISFRNRWSSSTSSRIASGSWSRCHRHSSRPAASSSPSGAAARAALIA
jgi:hypothetical protein